MYSISIKKPPLSNLVYKLNKISKQNNCTLYISTFRKEAKKPRKDPQEIPNNINPKLVIEV